MKWGKRALSIFSHLEKAKYNEKTCYSIFRGDGILTDNQEEILEVQRDFYKELYSKDEEVQFNMENRFGIVVPEKIRKAQCIQLSVDNLTQAVKRMANKKTPGEDGIPVDFYKVFWVQLREVFYDMMLAVFQRGVLHDTARRGILNLIPKANKDTRYVKNLRPITLLNTDYKIIEKAVADKMNPALEHIINSDQRGFMQGRKISVNIRKMLDIISMTKSEDLEAVILSLDFVKCFDKCSFSILNGSLDFFDFGENIKGMDQNTI